MEAKISRLSFLQSMAFPLVNLPSFLNFFLGKYIPTGMKRSFLAYWLGGGFEVVLN